MLCGILFLVFFTVYKNNAISNQRNGTIYNIIQSIITDYTWYYSWKRLLARSKCLTLLTNS